MVLVSCPLSWTVCVLCFPWYRPIGESAVLNFFKCLIKQMFHNLCRIEFLKQLDNHKHTITWKLYYASSCAYMIFANFTLIAVVFSACVFTYLHQLFSPHGKFDAENFLIAEIFHSYFMQILEIRLLANRYFWWECESGRNWIFFRVFYTK